MKHKRIRSIAPVIFSFLIFSLGCTSFRQTSPKEAVLLYNYSNAGEYNESVIKEITSRGAIYRIKAGEVFRFKISAKGDVFTTQEPAVLEFRFNKDSYLYFPPDMKGFGDLQISHDSEVYHRLSTYQNRGSIEFDLAQLKDGISANLELQYFSNP